MRKCVELKNQFISKNRLSQYQNINEYFENLKLCKQYYIPLSMVEITLRNSLNIFYAHRSSKDWLLDMNFLQPDMQYKVAIAKKTLSAQNKVITQDNLLAELSFGFWPLLFKKPYQQYLRYKDLKQIFPNLPSSKNKSINRHFIFSKLNNIRLFRNKVFHHDKIIAKQQYQNMMDEIYEVLNFFDNEIVKLTKEINND